MLARLALIRPQTDKTMNGAQRQCKKYFDSRVKARPPNEPGKLVSVDRSPLKMSGAEPLTKEIYSKLLPCTHRPYQVLAVQLLTVTVDKNRIAYALFIAQATRSEPLPAAIRILYVSINPVRQTNNALTMSRNHNQISDAINDNIGTLDKCVA